MPAPPHRSLVQTFIIVITLPVLFCFPQVDLRLEESVGDSQLATEDFYVSNIDVDMNPTPGPILKFSPDIFQQNDVQKFLQWMYPPEPRKCDNGLFAFCCNWPAPNPNIGIGRPRHVDPEEVKRRRRKCGKWNKDRPGCLIAENNFCCDCKDVNDIAYNCYNPFYRDDSRFRGKPEPKPQPLGPLIELDRPATREPDPNEKVKRNRDLQGGAAEENDRIERRAVVPSATNKIKSSTSTTGGAGGIGKTGADTQLLRAWKRAQPQAAADGDDSDGAGEDVEIMRAWKRVQPAVPDDDDTERAGADAQLLRAWKRVQPAVPDGDDTERAGADAQILRAWKRVQPAVPDGDDTERARGDAQLLRAWKRAQHEVADGNDTKRAGVDAQLLRAWERVPQPTTADSDDKAGTGAEDAQQPIKRAWRRAQPDVSADDNSEKMVPYAQFIAAWERSQSWNGENAKGSSSSTGEDGEIDGAEHYDGTTLVGNPRYNDPALCQKRYLDDLGIFS